jgi:hypothetical protein
MKELKELIKFAIKAPSGHNTQPWKFMVIEDEIHIHPDYSRELPVVDADHHELWISLGCALENLVVAGKKFGLKSDVRIASENNDQVLIKVKFVASDEMGEDELFKYVEARQSTRNAYNGEKLSVQDINDLKSSFHFPGITMLLFSQDEIKVLEPFIIEGSDRQFANRKFITELVDWCRFSEKEARGKGDGLWTASMGFPNVGSFIGTIALKYFISAKSEAKRWRKLIYSSSGFALFIADKNDIGHWVNLGRAFQRFGLTATKLNISHSHVNMPCEEIEVRKKMADSLKLSGKHPLLLIRLGHSNKMPYSFRRPVEEVITHSD